MLLLYSTIELLGLLGLINREGNFQACLTVKVSYYGKRVSKTRYGIVTNIWD